LLAAQKPRNEADRLTSLRALHLLDTPSEQRFDRITRLAARIFDLPIAYIALVDSDRQWFKSKCGLTVDETGREESFCGHTILQDEPMVVYDTLEDPRFADNPLVVDDPKVRFYSGIPLSGPNGFKVGTFCIADTRPWTPEEFDLDILKQLSELAQHELNMMDLIRSQNELIEAKSLLLRTRDQLDNELADAAAYVRSLIPPPIEEGPIHTKWTFETCSALGGDILGHLRLDESTVAVYLVDVMGHGVGAALHASAIQSAILNRILPDCDFNDPDSVCCALNKKFPMSEHGGRFFTMFYAVIDVASGRIRYANAGHPPPIISGGMGGTRDLDATTTIVGIGDMEPGSAAEDRLQQGEELWIYSDAAVELDEQSGNQFGVEGFKQAISVIRTSNPEDPTAAMRELLLSVSGAGAFNDDLSIIRVDWNPQRG